MFRLTGELHSLQEQGQEKEEEEDYEDTEEQDVQTHKVKVNYRREDTEEQDVQRHRDKENRSTDREMKVGAKIFWPRIEARMGRRIFNESLPTLVGIVSWGLGCARPTYAGM